ncbi:glutamate racemase [Thalassotalea sp. M1531]|uniref:Glutamate racemase n=1 Tax=Thalassotalea algicola TaxID=2716224 RepID=A0A7Y0Q7I9_9GAMM|nr:glutamate racemase [Thalassotalea algicola]NMP31100.1 glutamate racemase [Thalassotalea algicola]
MSITPNSPIGIFDSGIGGISIARCIDKLLPNEQLIYFADSQYAPYGDKSIEQIIERVNCVADYLIQQGVKAIVVACNTATVNAIVQLRARVDIPVIGVEPAIKPAASQSKNKRIGILVTSATATNERFLSLVEQYKGRSSVLIQPCPGLVQQIEQGKHDSEHCNELLDSFITPLIKKEIDTLVLGCTHYPLISQQIKQISGDKINIIETAEPVTKELKRRLSELQLLSSKRPNKSHQIVSTELTLLQQEIISHFWPSTFNFT